MEIRRREFLKATAASLILATPTMAQPPAPPASGSEITFLTIGDWGNRKFRKEAKLVAEAMARAAGEQKVKFILAAGDNFYPAGVSGIDDPLWQLAFEDVYSQKALNVPWYVALGNHDHKGSVQAQIDYSQHSNRWSLPQPYYVVQQRLSDISADFFFLDTNPLAQVGWWKELVWADPQAEAQLQWLERELAASSADWKIVVGHHPVFSGGSHGNTRFLAERLPPIFEEHGVQLYLNGHDHDLQHIHQGRTNYLTSGAAASSRETSAIGGTKFAEAKLGFLSTRLGPASATLSFIGADSSTLHEAVIVRGA